MLLDMPPSLGFRYMISYLEHSSLKYLLTHLLIYLLAYFYLFGWMEKSTRCFQQMLFSLQVSYASELDKK